MTSGVIGLALGLVLGCAGAPGGEAEPIGPQDSVKLPLRLINSDGCEPSAEPWEGKIMGDALDPAAGVEERVYIAVGMKEVWLAPAPEGRPTPEEVAAITAMQREFYLRTQRCAIAQLLEGGGVYTESVYLGFAGEATPELARALAARTDVEFVSGSMSNYDPPLP